MRHVQILACKTEHAWHLVLMRFNKVFESFLLTWLYKWCTFPGRSAYWLGSRYKASWSSCMQPNAILYHTTCMQPNAIVITIDIPQHIPFYPAGVEPIWARSMNHEFRCDCHTLYSLDLGFLYHKYWWLISTDDIYHYTWTYDTSCTDTCADFGRQENQVTHHVCLFALIHQFSH